MKNNNFCKVFQIDENHQVLYNLVVVDDEETGENTTAIEMKTYISGLQMCATMSGFKKNKKTPEEHLETVTLENAQDFFKNMYELINNEE